MKQKKYEKLYKERKHEENVNLLEKYKSLDITKLTLEEKESKEGLIKENEAHFFKKNMKNDKTPGTDGFTAEFLKDHVKKKYKFAPHYVVCKSIFTVQIFNFWYCSP